MGDFFTKNLWEEEPDFAKEDTDEQGENDDGQYEDNENYFGAQHVIALVDCHPDMFQKRQSVIDSNDDNEPSAAIDLSLKLIQTLLQQTIEQTVIRKTGKRNGVGILLYNTKMRRGNTEKGGRDTAGESDVSTDDDDDKMDDEDSDDDDKMDDEDARDENEDESKIQEETTVHRLLNLEPPGIRHVQTLRKIFVENRQQQQKIDSGLEANFCPSVDDQDPTITPLQTALEESTRMFLNAKCVRDPIKTVKGRKEYDSKSIWIFTNQANPYSDKKMQLVENIANEVKEQRIAIIVWPLMVPVPHSNSNININGNNNAFVSPFFESIASEVLFDSRLQSNTELHDGLEEVFQTMVKKRRTYYGPLHILRPGKDVGNIRSINDPAIMIDWYSVVQLLRRPGKVQIDTATKKETVKMRLTLEKDTGKEVVKFWTNSTAEQREHQRNQPGMQRFRQFFNFANELIPITPYDMKKINENANGGYAPGLTILGFKPRDSIPSHHSVLKTFLIFPNDTEVQGSENAFMHLHAAMLRKNVFAMGEALHRENSQSRLVAIYPFEETDHLPPGMYVKSLPFSDDMRKIAPDAASIEFDNIQKLQKLLPNKFLGNGLTYSDRNGNSKEVGLKREEPNEIVNSNTLISEDDEKFVTGNIATEELANAAMNLMNRQRISCAEIGESFENAALTEFYSYLKSVAFDTAKEENNYDTIVDEDEILSIAGKEIDTFRSCLPVDVDRPKASASRKRTRKTVPDDSGIDWAKFYRSDEIGMCKVDQLKKYLRSVGLPTSGRKDDLVERVTKSLEEKYVEDNVNIIKTEYETTHQEAPLMESL